MEFETGCMDIVISWNARRGKSGPWVCVHKSHRKSGAITLASRNQLPTYRAFRPKATASTSGHRSFAIAMRSRCRETNKVKDPLPTNRLKFHLELAGDAKRATTHLFRRLGALGSDPLKERVMDDPV